MRFPVPRSFAVCLYVLFCNYADKVISRSIDRSVSSTSAAKRIEAACLHQSDASSGRGGDEGEQRVAAAGSLVGHVGEVVLRHAERAARADDGGAEGQRGEHERAEGEGVGEERGSEGERDDGGVVGPGAGERAPGGVEEAGDEDARRGGVGGGGGDVGGGDGGGERRRGSRGHGVSVRPGLADLRAGRAGRRLQMNAKGAAHQTRNKWAGRHAARFQILWIFGSLFVVTSRSKLVTT